MDEDEIIDGLLSHLDNLSRGEAKAINLYSYLTQRDLQEEVDINHLIKRMEREELVEVVWLKDGTIEYYPSIKIHYVGRRIAREGGYLQHQAKVKSDADRAERITQLTLESLQDQIKTNKRNVKIAVWGMVIGNLIALAALINSIMQSCC
jgi:hypothetical protein